MMAVMNRHARILFASAAIFNYLAGMVFIFAMPQFALLIGMSPVPSEPLFLHFGGVLVLAFGWGYWKISCNPELNRPIIHMGIFGKSLVVIAGYLDWMLANTNMPFIVLISGDAVFAILFIHYLRTHPEKV